MDATKDVTLEGMKESYDGIVESTMELFSKYALPQLMTSGLDKEYEADMGKMIGIIMNTGKLMKDAMEYSVESQKKLVQAEQEVHEMSKVINRMDNQLTQISNEVRSIKLDIDKPLTNFIPKED